MISKKKEKVFAPKFRKNFPEISSVLQKKQCLQKNYILQAIWRSLRRHKIGHDLGLFSTSQKIVLSSSRGHFRGLAGSEAKAKDFRLQIVSSSSSVFRGAPASLIGPKSMQNTNVLALLGPIFALKKKIGLPHWHWR